MDTITKLTTLDFSSIFISVFIILIGIKTIVSLFEWVVEKLGFKLFIVDVGLLGCMTGLRQLTLLDGNDLFTEFKGALTEQYVCQQLKTIKDLGVYYYTNDRGSCEVNFIIDNGEQIVPVEVKAEVNLKAKSLKTYREKFNPEISVRTSMADYKKEDWLINLPLYAVEKICAL